MVEQTLQGISPRQEIIFGNEPPVFANGRESITQSRTEMLQRFRERAPRERKRTGWWPRGRTPCGAPYLGPVADEEPNDVGVALRGGQMQRRPAAFVRSVQLLGAPLQLVQVSEPGGAVQLGQRLGFHLIARGFVEAALETQVAHGHDVGGAATALAALAALHEADHPLHAPPCIALRSLRTHRPQLSTTKYRPFQPQSIFLANTIFCFFLTVNICFATTSLNIIIIIKLFE